MEANLLEKEKFFTDFDKSEVMTTKPESDFAIIVDNDSALNYEKRKLLYLAALPLMWFLAFWTMVKKLFGRPKTNTIWFDGISPVCRLIKEGSGSWKALDIICNYEFGTIGGIKGFVSDFWLGMLNAQAVRNRKKLAKRELSKAIYQYALSNATVRILSIASGSAQALIETIERATKEGIKVQAIFIDIDRTAVDYSNRLIRMHNLEKICHAEIGTALSMKNMANKLKPHIIEMIGFLDYRPPLKAIKLCERLFAYLCPGGTLLTANIMPNPEMKFLKWVIDWSMIYRSPGELGKILVEAGFDIDNCKIFCEPHKIHSLICAKK